ncbi:MAG: hypothetical protein KA498_07900 [Neisseriaceae bacterium]|nr:hypothetical protein [Neisseriaceae bacterium]
MNDLSVAEAKQHHTLFSRPNASQPTIAQVSVAQNPLTHFCMKTPLIMANISHYLPKIKTKQHMTASYLKQSIE